MKKYLFAFSLLFVLGSCQEDENQIDLPQNLELPPVAQYLNGKFDLQKVYYEGEVRSVLGTEELSDYGDSTEGFYHMYSEGRLVSYALNTYLEMEILGNQVDIPLEVGDSTLVQFDSDSSFVLNDRQLGTMRYVLGEQWEDSCRLHTTYNDDTAGFNMDLDLTMYLYRK